MEDNGGMSFFSRLFGSKDGGSRAPADDGRVTWLYVRCNRCGEPLRIRINAATDAQPDYDEENGAETGYYYMRKEILGNRCPNLMSVELRFDRGRRIAETSAVGCAVITPEEYDRNKASQTEQQTRA